MQAGHARWSYGAGVDQALGRRYFVGASYLHRNLDIPEAYCNRQTQWSATSGCAGFAPSVIEERTKRRPTS